MSCLTNPIEEDECVFVTYSGKSPASEIMSSRYVANRYLAIKRWNRIIVDITSLQSMPTTMELIGLASDLSSELPSNTRIALVVRPEQVEQARLIERVARIEGVPVACFLEKQQAKNWVKEEKSPGQTASRRTGKPAEKERGRS